MTAVNKQDSNNTDLRYAVETAPGVVSGSDVWYPLEPNSYKNFGSQVKTKQRMPINASRQLKKPVVVDVDAQGGIVQDLTADNFQDAAQCFLYAALRTKSEITIAVVDGSGNDYEPTSNGTAYWAKDLLFAKSFDETTNNGLKTVTGLPLLASVPVTDTDLVSETGATGIISRVGFEFESGDCSIDVSGAYPRLVIVTPVAATSTLTNDGTNITDGDSVTIGGKVYTFEDTLTNVDGHVQKGLTNTASMTNLFHAINASGGTVGTDYATATTANARVTATNPSGTTVVVTSRVAGVGGNAVTKTELSSHLAWGGGGTLAGGSGGRAGDSFGLIPGEFIYIGSDETNTFFGDEEDNGFCRVRNVASGYIEFDKTQFEMVTNNGSGKTIRIYFGRVLKNESDPTLIIKRGIQIERTLGAPDDAQPSQIQAEYLVRSLANELKVDFKTADIVRLELGFLANTSEFRTGAEGKKGGTRPDIIESDAFNTTSDVSVTKLAIVTSEEACPDPLFSFFTDMIITLKNNLKQNKAVKVLGAFDSTPGFFQVEVQLTAYFTDVAEMQAVIDNESITIETHMVKFNKGVTIDIPLVVASDANADVKLNEAIMLPLKSDAAASKSVNSNTDHTMLWVFWDYLPDLAD